jgi:dihydrofolate synthase/folylpolyglutamate synthase
VGAPQHFVRDRFKAGLPVTRLQGAHQQWNAGAAWLACELAHRLPVQETKIRTALAEVTWEARWQSLPLLDGRTLIIDGTHNEEGVRVVIPLLKPLSAPAVVVGAVGLTRAEALITGVAPWAGSLILVQPDNEKACTVEQLAAFIPKSFQGTVRRATVAELFNAPQSCQVDGNTVVVLGSLYLAGEVLARYHGKEWLGYQWQDRLPGTP